MKLDKRIVVLIIIIAILSTVLAYGIVAQQYSDDNVNNSTNKTKELNATLENTSQSTTTESGNYGYCAICGKALTYSEAHEEYTQGKVCFDCASNPYYQSGPGADYANQKLYEAYPDEYAWMYEDNYEDYDYSYDDYDYENDYDYSDDEY